MFDIGFWELLLIAVVALVVVGPERLPRLIRVTGLWLGRANASFQAIKNEIAKEVRAEELKQALKKTGEEMPNMNEVITPDTSATPSEKPPSVNKEQDGNG